MKNYDQVDIANTGINTIYHVCTSENHHDIFFCDDDYKSAINIMALTLALYEDLELFAFELMSNHIHLAISGSKDRIDDFFKMFLKYLARYFRNEGATNDLSDISVSYHVIRDLDHLLNVIVYIHRNASVANRQVSPYTYKWGSGRYYFNPEAKDRYLDNRKSLTMKLRQCFSHSRKFDNVFGLYEMDNYISPLCFCKVDKGESFFSSPNQYLYMLCKNVEGTRSIAEEIGEQITYSDTDLYQVVRKLASKYFNAEDATVLSSSQKMRIARTLHYDYNSGNKQVARLLKLDLRIADSLFPQSTAPRNR